MDIRRADALSMIGKSMDGKVMSATDARVHFGEVMREVSEHNETVIVERGGSPKIAIISAEELDALKTMVKSGEADWRQLLKEVHDQIRREGNLPLTPSPEEVIREMREERNAHFSDLH